MLLLQVAFSILVIQSTVAWAIPEEHKEKRSLTGTFPFAAHHQHSQGDHHQHDDHHAHPHTALDPRISRQGIAENSETESLSANALPGFDEIAQAGERCVEKVMMVEEITYDDQIVCHHSYTKKCHNTYITSFEAVQMEVCEDIFEKYCLIEYKKMAEDEEVEICNEVLERNCDTPGPTVCETVFESECKTSYHVHEVEEDKPNCTIQMMEKCRDITVGYTTEQKCDKWPQQVCTLEKVISKNTTPDTKCQKIPRDVCGPGPCPLVKSSESSCHTVVETVIHDVPEEKCDLIPRKDCNFVSKLIPYLKPAEECVDIPKEICVRAKVNPRKIKRPIVKKWCYTPRVEYAESSENDFSDDNDDSNDDDSNNDDSSEDTTLPPDSATASPVRRG